MKSPKAPGRKSQKAPRKIPKAPGRTYTIAEARNQLASLVHRSEFGPVGLTRRGKPVAVLLSQLEYDRLTKCPSLWDAIVQFRAEVDPADLPEDDMFADIRDRSPGREADFAR